jgi:hypothetical protein
MLDEMDRLRSCDDLLQLLAHYDALGKDDRNIWHDRLHEFAGHHGRDLARLYGELIAFGWLEQNTGVTPILEPGRLSGCYRINSAGQKALKQIKKEMREEVVG